MMKVKVEGVKDIRKRLTALTSKDIRKGTSQGLNRAADKVRTSVVRDIAKVTGGKQKEIRGYIGVRKSQPNNMTAAIVGKNTTKNLIHLLTRAKQSREFWRARKTRYPKGQGNSSKAYKRKGITVKAWNKKINYDGYFIMKGRGGSPIVAQRIRESGKRLRFPYGVGYGKAIRSPFVQRRALDDINHHAKTEIDARLARMLTQRGLG